MESVVGSQNDDPLDQFTPHIEGELDAGIRHAVLVLRSGGVETFESCEGGEGHSYLEPTVRFHGNSFAGYRAFSVAMDHGLPVADLRRVYDVIDTQLHGPWWEMTFRTTGRTP